MSETNHGKFIKNIVKVYMLKKWDVIESEKFIVKSYSDIVRVLVLVLDGV